MKKNNLSDGPSVSAPFANSKLGSTLVELLQGGSTAQKQLAEFILRNPMRMTAANIEDVSALAGVSPATISRFARELGFDSFAEMRSALADALLAVLAPVDKLRKTMAAAGHDTERGGTLDAARKQLALLDAADVERQCSRAAERIAAARSVHIMGFGLSAHIAGLATLGLQPFHPAVASSHSQP